MTAFPRSSLHDILDLTTGVLGRWRGRRCQSRTSLAWGRGILPLTHGRACTACLAVWVSICRLSHTCEHFPCSSPEHLPSHWTLALLVCLSLLGALLTCPLLFSSLLVVCLPQQACHSHMCMVAILHAWSALPTQTFLGFVLISDSCVYWKACDWCTL